MELKSLARWGSALFLPLVFLALLAATTARLSAAQAGVITVCLAGPPECDYQFIQPALDAAAAGDRVVIAAGIYSGQLTLRSHVAIESAGDPQATVITAGEGPVVTASSVVSASISGVTISGRGVQTRTVGLEVHGSEVSLSDVIVGELIGMNGQESAPDGETAVAIRSDGPSKLALDRVTIQQVRGGDGLPDLKGGTLGGDAIGIFAAGDAKLAITRTIIHELRGGRAGGYADWPYSCTGTGGDALAIQTSGAVVLTVQESQVTDLTGGGPCWAAAPGCIDGAGRFFGIDATGGTVLVQDSLFSRLSAYAADQGPISYAVLTASTRGTRLERNTFTSLSVAVGYGAASAQEAGPDSPFCYPPAGSVVAVASYGDAHLWARDNVIDGLHGIARGGNAMGISAGAVADVTLSGNQITGLSGGYSGPTARGLDLYQVQSAWLDANILSGIHASDAPGQFYYAYFGDDGGSARGIALTSVAAATVVNNVVHAVTAGSGTDMPEYGPGGHGGSASALLVSDSWARIWNNTCYQTTAGRGGTGSPAGNDGRAAGLRVTGASDVSAGNNIFAAHGVGISSTASNAPRLEFNDLWSNGTDYEGVLAGAGDLFVAPGLADPDGGDFHLRPYSALIDSGTNRGSPTDDMDGEPRPQDGNADRVAIADIGADEYSPGLHGTMTVDPVAATGGDILTYRVSLSVTTNPYRIEGVRFEDTLPAHVTYIPGSLSASSGAAQETGGVITWTGTVSTTMPVRVTFKTRIDQVNGPLAIINVAELDDPAGTPAKLYAIALVDPLRNHLPLIGRAQ